MAAKTRNRRSKKNKQAQRPKGTEAITLLGKLGTFNHLSDPQRYRNNQDFINGLVNAAKSGHYDRSNVASPEEIVTGLKESFKGIFEMYCYANFASYLIDAEKIKPTKTFSINEFSRAMAELDMELVQLDAKEDEGTFFPKVFDIGNDIVELTASFKSILDGVYPFSKDIDSCMAEIIKSAKSKSENPDEITYGSMIYNYAMAMLTAAKQEIIEERKEIVFEEKEEPMETEV